MNNNNNNNTNPFAVQTHNNVSSLRKKKEQKRRKRTSTRKNKKQDVTFSNNFTEIYISIESRDAFNNILDIITHSSDDEYGRRQPKSNEWIHWDKFNEAFRSLCTKTKKDVLRCQDTINNNQKTLLMYLLSIEGGPPEHIVSTLLDIDPSAVRMKEKSFRNWTCLIFAIYYNASFGVIKRLVDAYPDHPEKTTLFFQFVERDSGGNTPLHYLQSNTSLEIVELLLKKFPSLASVKNNEGLYPLHVATIKKVSLGINSKLLDAYPEAIFHRSEVGNKNLPLHLACQNMNVTLEEIKLLLKHDVEKKKTMLQKDDNDWLPLRYACESNVSEEVMQFLLHSFINAKMRGICDIPFYRSKIDTFLKTTLDIEQLSKKNYIFYCKEIEKFTSNCNLIESMTLLELSVQKENCLHGLIVIMNRTLDFINPKIGPDRMVSSEEEEEENNEDDEDSIIYNDKINSRKNDGILLLDDFTEDETSDEEMSL